MLLTLYGGYSGRADFTAALAEAAGMLSGPLRYLASILGRFRDAARQLHEVFERKVEEDSSDLIDWIATGATHEDTISRLHGTICDRLVAEGVPLGGSLLAFEAFHPIIAGRVTRWIEGQPVELMTYEAGDSERRPS